MRKIVTLSFLLILCLLSSIVFSGQILGFFGLYYAWLSLLLTAVTFVGFGYLLKRYAYPFLMGLFTPEAAGKRILNASGYIAGAALLFFLVLLPLSLWPYTNINQTLAWDAGVYHLPKAIELLVRHTAWDFSISYGEYAWGFESLLTFSYILSKAGMLIGLTHALIAAFFVLALFFLTLRFSHLPDGLLFFGVVVVFCSYDLLRSFDSNPWWLFRLLAFSIGKNDLFLADGVLALLAFSPLGRRGMQGLYSLAGMSLANLLVLSTKPNAVLIEAYVWGLTFVLAFMAWRQNRTSLARFAQLWILPALSFLVGGLWIIRNLIGTGQLMSQESLSIQQWSILNNLTNPFFYNYLDIQARILLALLALTLVFTLFSKRFHWNIFALMLVMLLSFIITPATAFFGSNQVPSEIDWRFGIYLLAFEVPLLLLMFDPILNWVFSFKSQALQVVLALILLAATGWQSVLNRGRFAMNEKNLIVLHDPFKKPVGVDGYRSAYDYIQKNVHHSVVWVENGMPFYLYDTELTNTVTRTEPAQYYAFFRTSLVSQNGYPTYLEEADWLQDWELVYQDPEGVVYKRR